MISHVYLERLAPRAFCAHNWIMSAKESRIFVRVTEQDRRMFAEVVEALGLGSTSDAVRFLMRERHREIFGTKKTKTPKRGK